MTQQVNTWDKFIQWDELSRDAITVKKIYVDITGNLLAGILLDQTIYWNLPSRNSDNESKLRIWKNGELWLAKRREDWWDEIRLSPKQYDNAIKILRQKNIVRTKVFKFNGDPTTHIALNKKILLELLDDYKKQSIEVQKQAENANKDSRTPMDSGSSPLGNKEIAERGIRKLPKGEEPITKTTTETTTIHSKECISNSKRVAETAEDFSIQQDSENDKPVGIQPDASSKAKTLRTASKGTKKKSKPEAAPCPKRYEPFLESWEFHTQRIFKGRNGVYTKSWRAIQKAVNGRFFSLKNTPTADERYYGTKLTLEKWNLALERFALMRNNADYYPKKKKTIRNVTPDTFLYNAFSGNKENKSYFITCVENEARLLAPQIKDVNPEYTEYIIEECTKRFGWDMSNGGREDAIRAGKRISQFFETNKDRIHLAEHHYAYVDQRVNTVLDALEKKERADYPVKPFFLHGDITFNNVLPEYLKRVGSMD